MDSSANGNGAKRADTAVARRTQSSFVTGTAASSGLGGTASSQSIDSIDEESKYSSNQSGVSAGPRGLERSSSALLPRWVPDKEAKKCRVCGTRFSFTVRRHHCRRCGQVVCGECSAQQVELSWEKKPARVCNQCFALHVAETPSRSGGSVDASSMSHPKASRSATVSGAALGAASPARTPVTRRQQTDGPQDPRDPRGSPSASESVLEPAAGVHAPHLSVKQQDVRMRQDTLPGWLYAFKPFSSAGESVGIGRVFVNVLAAENLPALDMLGTSDPYCIVRIKEEYDTYLENKAKDPAAPKPEEAVTSVVWKTLSPQWNEEFLLTVHNATHTLRVDLYDRDVGSADDPMGFVEIPLSTLSHQLRFDAWFDIQLTATKPDADSVALSAMKSGLKSVTDVFKLKEKDAKKDGADARLSKRRDTTPTTPVALSEGPRARLHLELHYTFSKVGEFFSHFHPKAPAPVPAEEFNVDKLYGQVMRLFAYLTPIFAVLGSISTVLSWEDPWTSGWVLFLFVSICVRPWLLPVLLQLLLIRYICSQYVHKKWLHAEKANKKLAVLKHSGSVEARVDEAAAITSPTSELTPANPNQPPPVADKANLNSVLRGTLNTSLAAAGWREWLQYYQNLLLWINDLLDTVSNLFTWRHQATTKAILIALVITTLYSIFLSFSHILMIAGVYVLTSFTVPVQFLTWLVWGLVGYFSRKKVSKKTVRVSKKNV